jgi:hypothetical protein
MNNAITDIETDKTKKNVRADMQENEEDYMRE